MITRIAVLFVASFMFFVDNDDTEIFQRSKDGRSGANHNLSISTLNLAPFIVLLTIRQTRVKDGYFLAKTSNETLCHLRCQRDLRYQQNGCLALVQGSLYNLQVNLGLPTSCNPLKEERRLLTANSTDNRIASLSLLWIQLQRSTCFNAFEISSWTLHFLLN